jgi:hypothetical protein
VLDVDVSPSPSAPASPRLKASSRCCGIPPATPDWITRSWMK